MAALTRYFDPQLNPDYERFKLRQAIQAEGESVDVYYTRLRKLASTCTGFDQSDEIRAQIIQNCWSSFLRKQILRQPGITLDEILVLARSHELADV